MDKFINSETFKILITAILTTFGTFVVNSINNRKLLMNRKKEEINSKCKDIYFNVIQSISKIKKNRMCIYDEAYIDELAKGYHELRLFADDNVIEKFNCIYDSIIYKNKIVNEIDPNFHCYLDNIDNYEVDEDGASPPAGTYLTEEEEENIEKQQFDAKVNNLFPKDTLDKFINDLYSAMRKSLFVDEK